MCGLKSSWRDGAVARYPGVSWDPSSGPASTPGRTGDGMHGGPFGRRKPAESNEKRSEMVRLRIYAMNTKFAPLITAILTFLGMHVSVRAADNVRPVTREGQRASAEASSSARPAVDLQARP